MKAKEVKIGQRFVLTKYPSLGEFIRIDEDKGLGCSVFADMRVNFKRHDMDGNSIVFSFKTNEVTHIRAETEVSLSTDAAGDPKHAGMRRLIRENAELMSTVKEQRVRLAELRNQVSDADIARRSAERDCSIAGHEHQELHEAHLLEIHELQERVKQLESMVEDPEL